MRVFELKEIALIKEQLSSALEKLDSFKESRAIPRIILKKEDRMNYVIDSMCDFYGISEERLFKRYRDAKYSNRKKMTIKLLRDIADISFLDIAERLGSRNSADSARFSYDTLSSDLQESSYGNKELKQEYKNILKYLGV